MILINYNGESLYLCNWPANWGAPVEAEFYLPADVRTALSDREVRSARGEALRVSSYSFDVMLTEAETTAFRNSMLAKTTERIAVPFWPGAMPQSEYEHTPAPGGLKISFELGADNWPDFSVWEIHQGRSPSVRYTVTDRTMTAPLILGHFTEEPSPSLETDECLEATLSFAEDGDASEALWIDPQTFNDGPGLGTTSPKLFPLRHDFSKPATSGGTRILLDRERIGQGNRSTDSYHGAAAARFTQFEFPCYSVQDWAELLRFFQDARATSGEFWMPSYLAECRLTTAVAGGSAALTVNNAAALGAHRYIALVDRERITPVKVDSITGNTLNLAEPVGAFDPQSTSLCALLLCRFAKRRLGLRWQSTDIGECSIEFRELKPEYVIPAGETRGASIGQTPVMASLYDFKEVGVDGALTWRYTSYERDLTDRLIERIEVRVVGSQKPDDDFRVRMNGVTVSDPQRNVGDYALDYVWAADGLWGEGTLLEVDMLDGWQSFFIPAPWEATIYWVGGSVTTVSGGSSGPAVPSHPDIPTASDLGLTGPEYWSTGPYPLGNLTEEVNYFPNGSAVLTAPEHNLWEAIGITHGAIERTLTFEDQVSLTASAEECEPLALMFAKAIGQVDVKITRAEVVDGAIRNARVVFNGQVKGVRAVGNKLEAEAGLGRAFEAMVPAGRNAWICQWGLFSKGCNLLRYQWTWTGQISDPGVAGFPFTFSVSGTEGHISQGAGLANLAADFFAWGMAKIGDRYFAIRSSSAVVAGALTVTLDRDPNPYPEAGDSIELVPGCNGGYGTCRDKFGNSNNFGAGQPAPANISLIKVNLPSGESGGKK